MAVPSAKQAKAAEKDEAAFDDDDNVMGEDGEPGIIIPDPVTGLI
jgi:hypothetical protein